MTDQRREDRSRAPRGTRARPRRRVARSRPPLVGHRSLPARPRPRRSPSALDLHDRPHLDRAVARQRHPRGVLAAPRRDRRTRAGSSRPRISLVTANGPSVISVSPSRTRTVVAASTGCRGSLATKQAGVAEALVELDPQWRLGLTRLAVLAIQQQRVPGHGASVVSNSPHQDAALIIYDAAQRPTWTATPEIARGAHGSRPGRSPLTPGLFGSQRAGCRDASAPAPHRREPVPARR